MGREIKRVALDFDWPLRVAWPGFLNPFYERHVECPDCEGTGYSKVALKLKHEWYGFDKPRHAGWCYNLLQEDVDALLAGHRLWDFTRNGIEHPTADQVNEWAKRGMGHDSVNSHICIKARCERLGAPIDCPRCDGHGEYWPNKASKWLYETWKDIEPPPGDGWQVWETVSEGSPVTPVFPTADALVAYLVADGYSKDAAEAFVQDGSVPSLAVVDGKVYSDIEIAAIPKRDEDEDTTPLP